MRGGAHLQVALPSGKKAGSRRGGSFGDAARGGGWAASGRHGAGTWEKSERCGDRRGRKTGATESKGHQTDADTGYGWKVVRMLCSQVAAVVPC